MNKLKYLSKNLALFTISNFVSKILVFLLVPFYTNVLSTYEYGIADIIQVTLILLVPAVTVNIGEAALRFGIEKENKRGNIFKIGIKYVVRAQIIVTVMCLLALLFVDKVYKVYLIAFIVLFASNAVYEFLILYFQGSELVQIVVIGSVSCTIFTIISNMIFLLVLKTGLNGYLISQIIAFSLASFLMIYLGVRNGVIKKIAYDDELEEEMLLYSKPMIVYSTASWINNAADRYFVAYLCGAAVNGLYGVAYKIPAILMVFQRIFAQAWQMSATKVYGDSNKDEFYSYMYKVYNTFMVIGCGGLILILKPLAILLFRKEFYVAWTLVPPLLISVIFGALTGFLGSICLAYKDSKSMGLATGIGAFINIVLNLLFIPKYGAMGASVATAISYFTMCTLARLFVEKYVVLKINVIKDYIAYFIIIAEAVVMIMDNRYSVVICAALLIVLFIIYLGEIKELLGVLLEKIKGFKGEKNV